MADRGRRPLNVRYEAWYPMSPFPPAGRAVVAPIVGAAGVRTAAEILAPAEDGVLACLAFPREHWNTVHS